MRDKSTLLLRSWQQILPFIFFVSPVPFSLFKQGSAYLFSIKNLTKHRAFLRKVPNAIGSFRGLNARLPVPVERALYAETEAGRRRDERCKGK